MLKIAELSRGLPVPAESTATTADGMVEEGLPRLAALAPNIVIKLPVCEAGLEACRKLADQGVRVNMTLVFSAPQALLAAVCRRALHQPVYRAVRRYLRRRCRPACRCCYLHW